MYYYFFSQSFPLDYYINWEHIAQNQSWKRHLLKLIQRGPTWHESFFPHLASIALWGGQTQGFHLIGFRFQYYHLHIQYNFFFIVTSYLSSEFYCQWWPLWDQREGMEALRRRPKLMHSPPGVQLKRILHNENHQWREISEIASRDYCDDLITICWAGRAVWVFYTWFISLCYWVDG